MAEQEHREEGPLGAGRDRDLGPVDVDSDGTENLVDRLSGLGSARHGCNH